MWQVYSPLDAFSGMAESREVREALRPFVLWELWGIFHGTGLGTKERLETPWGWNGPHTQGSVIIPFYFINRGCSSEHQWHWFDSSELLWSCLSTEIQCSFPLSHPESLGNPFPELPRGIPGHQGAGVQLVSPLDHVAWIAQVCLSGTAWRALNYRVDFHSNTRN